MVEEVQGRKGRKGKKGGEKPTSLFKRGSWVSNLNLGFRSGNSRKASLASTTNSFTPLSLAVAQDDAETRSSKNGDEANAPQLLQHPSQKQPKSFEPVQPGVQYLGEGLSMGDGKWRQRKVNKLGEAGTDWELGRSGDEGSRRLLVGNRRNRTVSEAGTVSEVGKISAGNRRKRTETVPGVGKSSTGNYCGEKSSTDDVGLGDHRWPVGGETRVTEEL